MQTALAYDQPLRRNRTQIQGQKRKTSDVLT